MSLIDPDAHAHVLPSTRRHVPTCPGWKPAAQMFIPKQPTQVHPSDAKEHEGTGAKPCLLPTPAGLGDPLCPLLEPTGMTFLPESRQDFLAASLPAVQKSGTRHVWCSGLTDQLTWVPIAPATPTALLRGLLLLWLPHPPRPVIPVLALQLVLSAR